MKRVMQMAALAIVAAAGMATTQGCQNSGDTDTTGRPMNASAAYDRPYAATRDTVWLATPTAETRTALPRGTRAYFADTPTSAEWQQARVEGQGVVWVRPADFAAESR